MSPRDAGAHGSGVPVIEFDEVTKRYAGAPAPAIDTFSLRVEPGEFIVLLGGSGSGKTTLLKMVNRLLEPTNGRVLIDGADARSLPATHLRRRIGYVIQQVGLFPHQTVAGNIATVPRILGWDRARTAARVDLLLSLMRMPPEEFRARRPRELSGGQQQRVGIARALAGDPGVLLMDEPFGALDAITRRELQDELQRIHARLGKTVLFVTHDTDEALRLADRIVVLDRGVVQQVGAPRALLTRPANEYVRRLIGADDVMRALAVLTVARIARPAEPNDAAAPVVGRGASIREALGALLVSGAPRVRVVDEAGATVGAVTWEDVRRAVGRDEARA
jgi:osmoprotectant transport system ATP-binding protein